MIHLIKFFYLLKNSERGQGMVEYGIIVALVVIIAVAVFAQGGAFGAAIANIFTKLAVFMGFVSP